LDGCRSRGLGGEGAVALIGLRTAIACDDSSGLHSGSSQSGASWVGWRKDFHLLSSHICCRRTWLDERNDRILPSADTRATSVRRTAPLGTGTFRNKERNDSLVWRPVSNTGIYLHQPRGAKAGWKTIFGLDACSLVPWGFFATCSGCLFMVCIPREREGKRNTRSDAGVHARVCSRSMCWVQLPFSWEDVLLCSFNL